MSKPFRIQYKSKFGFWFDASYDGEDLKYDEIIQAQTDFDYFAYGSGFRTKLDQVDKESTKLRLVDLRPRVIVEA